MKKIYFALATLVALVCFSNTASAIPIFYRSGDQAVVTHTLPDSIIMNDKHVDFGVAFKEFAIMWIPAWTWGTPTYVVIDQKNDTYYDLDEEQLAWLGEEFDIDIEKPATIPFWHRIGGKSIWALLILGIAYEGVFGKKKKEDEEEVAEKK